MINLLTVTPYLRHLDKVNTAAVNACNIFKFSFLVIMLIIIVFWGMHDKTTLKQRISYGIIFLFVCLLYLGSIANIHYHTPAHTLALHTKYTRQIARVKHVYPKLPTSNTHKIHYTDSVSYDAAHHEHKSKSLCITKSEAIKKYRYLKHQYYRTNPQKIPKNHWWRDI